MGLVPRFRAAGCRPLQQAGRLPLQVFGYAIGVFLCALCLSVGAAEIDESKLPPAASVPVDFDRDIKPIFESSCFKCHGPEKPKGKFRLTSRENALKGGENNTDDVVPGNSGKSKLIHYVARLVEDMEMPPTGKGESLTKEQIGLLRAWIDRDAVWGTTAPPEPKFQMTITPALRWTSVSGDRQQFREHRWRREGWAGGAGEFQLKQKFGEDRVLTLEGRALPVDEDYKLALTLEKYDVGFIRGGVERYRHYYDDTGGYYGPFNTPPLSLGQDLHLDYSRAWIDVGLTLPKWPRVTLGYEYQEREGAKSLLQWGPVPDAPILAKRNIYPAYKAINENVHLVKFELNHEVKGLLIEDKFRGEFYDLATRQNTFAYTPGAPLPRANSQVDEGYRHFVGANALRLERQFNGRLLVSGGYLYRVLDAEGAVVVPIATVGGFPTGPGPSSPRILFDQQAHVLSANAQWGAWGGLTAFAGVQTEWNRQSGVGDINSDYDFDSFSPIPTGTLHGNLDRFTREENLGLRYTKIPFTVLFAEGRLQQEDIGQYEDEFDTTAGTAVFVRNTEFSTDLREGRMGFSTSPWSRLSLSGNYKRRSRDSDYNHGVDVTPALLAFSGNGYSAFIRRRELDTDEIEAKLVWRMMRWLKTTFTYQLVATDFHTTTDSASDGLTPTGASPGGRFFAGNQDAHVYSVNAVLTPWRRLYLSGTFSYRDTRLETSSDFNPVVVPYKGDVYSVLGSANYVLSQSMDWQTTYSFSRARYGQSNETVGLPLGIDYEMHGLETGLTRKISKNLTTNLKYGFYYYDEISRAGANNYKAHAIFASISLRLP